ncbi:MAG: 23S rRNA (adenine(2030)-N(6))-methyltransferase RlmJ [Burkholderiales bacterium]|jgi:23S rRNA (adenine2030-N6)-methyltransferase|nr:23S rRNA (adenine(2030)-N(6))-methyltransferase RlmJ [Burkholderiales bacterium]
MLSYRHAFHAGNHADVFKHHILVELLTYLNQKDKPYYYIDTHAGAGMYSLTEGYAAQNAEYESGIGKLWQRRDAPESLARYVDIVRSFNPDGVLRYYPGSPLIAQKLIRASDRLRLFELHPADGRLLRQNCGVFLDSKQTKIQTIDGFGGIKAVLPPASRRGLILIDPAYEAKSDYTNVVAVLREGMKRFATGVYAVWHPCLAKRETHLLTGTLRRLPFKNWLYATLTVQKPSMDGFGMHGSAMFIGNPPWTLAENLKETLLYLVRRLGKDESAAFTIEAL